MSTAPGTPPGECRFLSPCFGLVQEASDGFRHSSKAAAAQGAASSFAQSGPQRAKPQPGSSLGLSRDPGVWGGAGSLSDKLASALNLRLPDPQNVAKEKVSYVLNALAPGPRPALWPAMWVAHPATRA